MCTGFSPFDILCMYRLVIYTVYTPAIPCHAPKSQGVLRLWLALPPAHNPTSASYTAKSQEPKGNLSYSPFVVTAKREPKGTKEKGLVTSHDSPGDDSCRGAGSLHALLQRRVMIMVSTRRAVPGVRGLEKGKDEHRWAACSRTEWPTAYRIHRMASVRARFYAKAPTIDMPMAATQDQFSVARYHVARIPHLPG